MSVRMSIVGGGGLDCMARWLSSGHVEPWLSQDAVPHTLDRMTDSSLL